MNDSQEKWDKLEGVNYSHENEKMSTFYILTDTARMKGNHCLHSIELKQMHQSSLPVILFSEYHEGEKQSSNVKPPAK